MYESRGYHRWMLDLPLAPSGAAPGDASGGGAPEPAVAEPEGGPGAAIAEAGAAVLDDAQRQAVDHGEGPCLVLAGPGSGKTRVIVERFLRLVREGTPADRLLVLTYTRKAAAEMRDRVERVHGPFEGDPPLLNYHSFAQRVLRRWGWRLGISPAFRIADDAERWLVVDAILAELRPTTLYNPLRAHDLVDPILDLIEKAKQELVSPEDVRGVGRGASGRCRREPGARAADPSPRMLRGLPPAGGDLPASGPSSTTTTPSSTPNGCSASTPTSARRWPAPSTT